MRFEDERYVRVYVRDTTTWLMLRWEGQAVFVLLMRKVDRCGVFDLGGADPADAVTAMLQIPEDVVRIGIERLLKYGVIEKRNDCLVVAKFIEAQEASMSPSARQKESRLRRRDQLRAGLDPSARETVIYFIQSEHGGPIKIGRAEDLAKRLVGLQTSRPDKLVILAAVPGTVADEQAVHDRFRHIREKGEWFSATPELQAYVREVGHQQSLDVTVTFGDESQNELSHKTNAVTPSRTVPSCAEGEERSQSEAPETPKKPAKRPKLEATRLPEDWQPPPDLVDRIRRELRVDPMPALRRFKNHFLNSTNRNAIKPRWDLAFENWVDRDASEGRLPKLDIEETLPIHRAPDRDKYIPKLDETPPHAELFGVPK